MQKDASKQPSALFQLGFLHPDREKALTIKKKSPTGSKNLKKLWLEAFSFDRMQMKYKDLQTTTNLQASFHTRVVLCNMLCHWVKIKIHVSCQIPGSTANISDGKVKQKRSCLE